MSFTKILTKKDVEENADFYVKEILSGKIFIYPTDTLYGLGTNATLDNSVKKIYEIKKRDNKALLVIVPSFDWLNDNTIILNDEHKKLITEKLPGPYSFILGLKNNQKNNLISKHIHFNTNTIGIRVPNNWFYNLIEKANIPFTSTSVNFTGEPSITKIKNIPTKIIEQVDYVIEDDNSIPGKSSTIIDLRNEEIKLLR